MAVNMKQVRAALDQEEPNYDEAAKLGPDALPHLRRLVGADDALLASKAAYLAGVIDADKSPAVLDQAAQSEEPVVRVAAAAAAQHLSAEAPELFQRLLSDDDPGVRRSALKSVGSAKPEGVREKVEQLATGDAADHVRELARKTARELRKQ
jgi:HEAT repeat protein